MPKKVTICSLLLQCERFYFMLNISLRSCPNILKDYTCIAENLLLSQFMQRLNKEMMQSRDMRKNNSSQISTTANQTWKEPEKSDKVRLY